MKNILVAIDLPKNANELVNYASRLAKHTNAKIWIIHVTKPDPDDFLALEAGPQFVYDERAEERKRESVTVKQLAEDVKKQHYLVAEGLLIEGPVIKSIKKLVEERDIDLVVAGHEKKNYLYGLFTSNKKKDLIDELKIPLLAVPLKKTN